MQDGKPQHLLLNGVIREWDEALVHVTTETALRGINVFEGIRAYWDKAQRMWFVLELEKHIERLINSCAVLRITCPTTHREIREGIQSLIACLALPSDLYMRLTVYVESGGYVASSSQMSVGWYVTAYPVPSTLEHLWPSQAIISQWVKYPEQCFPSQVKAGGAYLLGRMPRLEAIDAGCNEAILTNAGGAVCEATGANIVISYHGQLVSPPVEDGPLDGITLNCLQRLLSSQGLGPILRQRILVESIINADEVFLCGTLDEIRPVIIINGCKIGNGEIGSRTRELASLFKMNTIQRLGSGGVLELMEVPLRL